MNNFLLAFAIVTLLLAQVPPAVVPELGEMALTVGGAT